MFSPQDGQFAQGRPIVSSEFSASKLSRAADQRALALYEPRINADSFLYEPRINTDSFLYEPRINTDSFLYESRINAH